MARTRGKPATRWCSSSPETRATAARGHAGPSLIPDPFCTLSSPPSRRRRRHDDPSRPDPGPGSRGGADLRAPRGAVVPVQPGAAAAGRTVLRRRGESGQFCIRRGLPRRHRSETAEAGAKFGTRRWQQRHAAPAEPGQAMVAQHLDLSINHWLGSLQTHPQLTVTHLACVVNRTHLDLRIDSGNHG